MLKRLLLVADDLARNGPADDLEVIVTVVVALALLGIVLVGAWRTR